MRFMRYTGSRVLLMVFVALPAVARPARGQSVAFSGFEGIAVSTADSTEVSRMTDGGVVAVGEGSGGMVVTLAGEMRGRAERDGVIGLILVPELPFFTNVYQRRKRILSAAEFTAPIAAGESSYFMSKSKRADVGFSAYHLYLYNTTGASASVNVYVNPVRN